MAVAFDAASEDGAFSGISSISWTHTPVGTPTGVGITISISNGNLAQISSVTYGGASATNKVSRNQGTVLNASIWGKVNPASGAQTVAATFSTSQWGNAGAVTVTGGDTTDMWKADTAATGSEAGGNPSITVANVTSDDLVIDCFTWGNVNNPTCEASQTQRMSGLANSTYAKSSTQPGSVNGVMSWTTSGFPRYAICACAFAPGSSTQSYSYTASGGLSFAGAAAPNRNRVLSAAGGLVFAGAAAAARVAARLAAGGVQFGGAAIVAFHEAVRTVVASGGLSFGGAASIIRNAVGAVFNYVLFARRRGRR